MANVFTRSWEITKLSFNIIKQDKELLLFPVLASIFSLIFIIAILFPTIILAFLNASGNYQYGLFEYIILFITYFGLSFIATFFNVGVVYIVKTRLDGGNATFGESIKFAFTKIHLIFAWSVLSATIGLIFRVIENIAERGGKLGEIIAVIITSVLGMVWGIITIFVIPAMVYHDLGPIDAIKKSIETLKKTWGESLIRSYGLGLIMFIFVLLGIIITVVLMFLTSNLGIYAPIIIIALSIIYFVAIFLVFGVANTIFNTALFVYADTGKIPAGYDEEIMRNSFTSKNKPAASNSDRF
ncbi:TPA: hypothetical protein HA246_06730 [Candidatus Woesearchaeota archaeon]|nr:hypothetical protein [Candidatus Woesearchaeota archaeon]